MTHDPADIAAKGPAPEGTVTEGAPAITGSGGGAVAPPGTGAGATREPGSGPPADGPPDDEPVPATGEEPGVGLTRPADDATEAGVRSV